METARPATWEQGRIVLLQTAAGPVYEAMLAATAPAHHAFCAANGIEFVSFTGVRRGFHPWHACYNRIEMLRDLLDAGYRGWVFYLDADAVIRQVSFDLRRYLGKRQAHALIAAPSKPGAERWDINDGIFFLNLGDERGQEIARRWHESFYADISDAMLRVAVEPWRYPDGTPFPGDQFLLQMILLHNPHLCDGLLLDDSGLINFRVGRFICQFLRAIGSPEERLTAIRAVVAAAG